MKLNLDSKDYIFILDPINSHSRIKSLLSPHLTADLVNSIPLKGVSSSDHVSLAAEISWTKHL